ncbi:hypothetical protein VNI00_017592 [Paramarasmius palmivorus]|uniref:AB hydrolase-1 domain-containing protein n=1 Tax=Paramarasmius palmivorus TaxID=297713 RepID=A0AAW0B3V3_9AGAR
MRRGIRLVLATLLSLLGGGTLAVDPSQSPSESAHLNPRLDWTEASWASIEPSKELAWVKCYDGTFECARLQVPLDYSNPESQSAAIALIRIKSNVSTDSPDYLGPVLYNPGGPGVSGIDLVLGIGQSLVANVLGPEFDFVGFDPRGIARSTPRVSWYETRVERQLWSQPTVKELNHSSDNVASYWTRTKITGQLAEERASDILPYMQTDFTAHEPVICSLLFFSRGARERKTANFGGSRWCCGVIHLLFEFMSNDSSEIGTVLWSDLRYSVPV